MQQQTYNPSKVSEGIYLNRYIVHTYLGISGGRIEAKVLPKALPKSIPKSFAERLFPGLKLMRGRGCGGGAAGLGTQEGRQTSCDDYTCLNLLLVTERANYQNFTIVVLLYCKIIFVCFHSQILPKW